MDSSDEQLIKDYLSGDEKSLEILISRYLRPIYGFIYKYAHNAQETEDITQDVFVKVWRNLKKFDPQKSPAPYRIEGSGSGFKTWIFTIAKHTSIDWLKKKRTIPMSELPELLGDIKSTIKEDLIDGFEMMIKNLPLLYREVLTLYYDDHFNFREIAEILEKPIDTIKSRHRRALIALKKLPD